MGEVSRERTGWRDKGISERHRMWGVECQATDIDFLLLEYYSNYDIVRPAAFIEYKNAHAQERNSNGVQYKAICAVSNSANLPFFIVVYTSDFKNYRVIPMNKWARVCLDNERTMTEADYVSFLYRLRRLNVPPNILAKIATPKPQTSLFSSSSS